MTSLEDKKINVERDVNVHFEDKKRSRSFFWFMWITYAVVMMTKSCFNSAMADIVYEGFLTKQQTGFIIMAFYIVYTPLQIFGGIASDKFSPERLIEIGLLGAAISNTVIFFNQSYALMLSAWIFNAASQFALWSAIFKIVSSQCVRSERAEMIFLLSLSPSAGILLSYAVAAILPRWQLNFLVSALSLFALLLTLAIWDRRINKYLKWDKEPPVPIESADKKSHGGALKLFYASGFIFMLLSVFFRDTVAQSSKSIGPTLLLESFNTSPSTATLLNLLVIFSSILAVLASKLAIKLGLVKNMFAGTILGNAATLACALFFLLAKTKAATLTALCLLAFSTTVTVLFTNMFSSTFVKYGKNATAAGLLNCAASLGFLATSGVTLSVAEVSGWGAVKLMLLVFVAVSVLFSVLSFILNAKFEKNAK